MTLGSNLLLSFFCPFLICFTIWRVNVRCLQKITAPAFLKLLWLPPFATLFTLLFQWTPHATLPQLPASLQMSSTAFACWQWIALSACDCWSRASPASLRKALIALGCKHFCHLLHWTLQPRQCHWGDITSGCSKCPEVDALSPERNAPLMSGYIFNSTWALATLYQNNMS